MSQQNLPNGIPPHMANFKDQINTDNRASPTQKFNGVSSTHSSRDSSPTPRLGHIPHSQMPPGRPNIPSSQLPPNRSTQINPNTILTNQLGQLNINKASTVSPNFSTSTPNQSLLGTNSTVNKFGANSAFSPITTSANISPKSSHLPNIVETNGHPTGNIQVKPQPSTVLQNIQLPSQNILAPASTIPNNSSRQQENVLLQHGQQSPFHVNPMSQPVNQQHGQPSPFNVNPTSQPTNLVNQPMPFKQSPLIQPVATINQNNFAQKPVNTTSQNLLQSQFPQQNIQSRPATGIIQPSPQTKLTEIPLRPPLVNQNVNNIQQQFNTNSVPQKLQTSMSQPKLLPQKNQPLQQNLSQVPLQQQSNFNSAPNIYQSVATNLPQTSNYNQIPQNTNIQAMASSSNIQQKSSLHNKRYPTNINSANPVPQTMPNYSQYGQQQQMQYGQQPQVRPQQPQLQPRPLQMQPQQPQMQPQQPQMQPQQPQMQPQPQQMQPQQPQMQPQQQQIYNQKQQFVGQQPNNIQQNYGYGTNSTPLTGFNKMWGREQIDLLQHANILPPVKVDPPKIHLGLDALDGANCSSDVFRCTVTKIPETNSLLQKSRLPLGVLIHPFKDLSHLAVIQCNVIVRCRSCRTYINPFVYFVDNKRWKCNLCYRINELPEEFQYDPVSKTYGDPGRRPEVRSSTIEYIAPAEYMLRPPQPAVYLFLLDVSRLAVESGYLQIVCATLLDEIKNIPGDARTQVGFITYDSSLHFFSLGEGLSQPHEMNVLEIDDIFLPTPDNLLVNLKDRMELIVDLLNQLPTRYNNTYDTNSALGAALQASFKLMSATGGRVTVFQSSLPNVGPGALTAREDPNQRSSTEVSHLNPANDFYKRLSLECSAQQIAVDLFTVNSQYVDIATISGISRFSGGCLYHFPLFKASRTLQAESLERCFRRYLTRKIGFEAVMRIRCTRGLSIHTFHGNFFVRSTDLLSLPNINPDTGYGMQVSIDESLADVQTVCFQAALLYTSSKGERRIRVHTMCLPIASTLQDIIDSADQQCIVGLLSKMAVDRSMQSSLADAREAFINVAIDILSSYKLSQNVGGSHSGLIAPNCLKLLPLYISALLKHQAFRTGTSTRLDDRVKAMIDMKTKPLHQLLQQIYPDLYPIHNLEDQPVVLNADEEPVPQPPHLQLTARCLEQKGAFLLDLGEHMIILVCGGVDKNFLNNVLGIPDYNSITDEMYELPVLENSYNQRVHQFITHLNDDKPFVSTLQIIRDNSANRSVFFERLVEDRVESALSYHEFLQHLKSQVK